MLTSTLLVFVTALFLELVRRRWQLFRYFEKRGIPGPRPHFLWGHYHLLRADSKFWLDKWTKEYGDTFGVFWGNTPMLVSSDLDLQQKVLIKEFSNFVNRAPLFTLELAHPVNRPMLIHEQGTRWKNLRSAITPSFSSARMKAMTPLVMKSLRDFERNLLKQGSDDFDLYPLLKRLTIDNIGRTAFGVDARTQVDTASASSLVVAALEFIDFSMGSAMDLIATAFSGFGLEDILHTLFRFNILYHCSTKLADETKKIINVRRDGPKRNDLLQTLLDGHVVSTDTQSLMASGDGEDRFGVTESGKKMMALSEEQVVGNSIIMFAGGYETTSTGLASVLCCLGTHPEVQNKLRRVIVEALGKEGSLMPDTDTLYTKVMSIKYLDQCVHEALRLFPPVTTFTSRMVGETTEFNGLKLESGLGLIFPTHLANHSPRYWTDPLTYNPDRFAEKPSHPLAYQTFGDGPRNCVGMRLALMSIKLTLCHILPKMSITVSKKCVWRSKHVLCQPHELIVRVQAI